MKLKKTLGKAERGVALTEVACLLSIILLALVVPITSMTKNARADFRRLGVVISGEGGGSIGSMPPGESMDGKKNP